MIPTNIIEYKKVIEHVKKQVKRWPSAYASGIVVQQYKRIMASKGKQAYLQTNKKPLLKRWFNEKWVNIKTGKPCGSVRSSKYYPTCRPSIRVSRDTPRTIKEISRLNKKHMISQKQKAKQKIVHYKYIGKY